MRITHDHGAHASPAWCAPHPPKNTCGGSPPLCSYTSRSKALYAPLCSTFAHAHYTRPRGTRIAREGSPPSRLAPTSSIKNAFRSFPKAKMSGKRFYATEPLHSLQGVTCLLQVLYRIHGKFPIIEQGTIRPILGKFHPYGTDPMELEKFPNA